MPGAAVDARRIKKVPQLQEGAGNGSEDTPCGAARTEIMAMTSTMPEVAVYGRIRGTDRPSTGNQVPDPAGIAVERRGAGSGRRGRPGRGQ